ncbi:MAG: efflux RND transporter periplasmic adaptor subunit [Bryobacteraceae bacterium]|nr:efflux RND transporter periplasmic adaptor subunit [Bryobacteraceae bacterium]
MTLRKALIGVVVAGGLLALAAISISKFLQPGAVSAYVTSVPTAAVKRGEVAFTVAAKGELQGGNSEMLVAPMTGSGSIGITYLRESGELVKQGEVVAKFDTTEQEFKLREAQADLAEAGQQLIQAQAESEAKQEEARYELVKAKSEQKVAELEVRRNELLSRLAAKQNDLTLASATDKVRQLEKDYQDRVNAARAGIAMQEAARSKAQVASDTAQRNIDSMTLRARSTGYVARQQNTQGNFNWGSYLPALQVGDNARPGMAVAQIPDLRNWEIVARIGELDRGHLAVGQQAGIEVVALPGKKFSGTIRNIGGTTGPPWDRRFECKIAVDHPTDELRPGMSVRMVITTQVMNSALWLPSQALFESDGRKYIYVHSGAGFRPKDVTLVRRSESRVVVDGVKEGELVALANPENVGAKKASGGGALKAIQR